MIDGTSSVRSQTKLCSNLAFNSRHISCHYVFRTRNVGYTSIECQRQPNTQIPCIGTDRSSKTDSHNRSIYLFNNIYHHFQSMWINAQQSRSTKRESISYEVLMRLTAQSQYHCKQWCSGKSNRYIELQHLQQIHWKKEKKWNDILVSWWHSHIQSEN